ncbi:MAG TPA: glycosyltransferase [Bacteroidota bacterium]|nr:glycosyltransferase [Bacteroidota bacterium]
MKQVLVLTYFWPPSGKASLHWPLRMVQQLPTFGWQPTVLTVDEDTFSQKDESLLKEVPENLQVVRARAFEPFNVYRRFLGKKKNAPLVASESISTTNRSLRHRIAIWIRMNLFIPDARIGWYWNAVRHGMKILRSKKFDAIVSNGPPHTTLLIGNRLSELSGVPHIPVFIDPWVDIAYYRDFERSKPTLALDRHFERSVLEHASRIIFVTKSMQENYAQRYAFVKNKSQVLYWGFDESAFAQVHKNISTEFETILHAGNMFDYQNPPALWKSIRQEIDHGRKLRLYFTGTVGPAIRNEIQNAGLTSHTEFLGFLPHAAMVEKMVNADYLVFCATEKRHVPGKLFEYLRAGKKIIGFGDDNKEIEEILQQVSAGKIFPYRYEKTDIFTQVDSVHPTPAPVSQFSRNTIAKQLAILLDGIKF